MDDNPTYQNGITVRKQVMGDAHVERSMGQVTPFTAPLQDWINEHAWGSTWQRDGIDRKTRSLITMAFLIAQKSPTELKGHIRGAINNGCNGCRNPRGTAYTAYLLRRTCDPRSLPCCRRCTDRDGATGLMAD